MLILERKAMQSIVIGTQLLKVTAISMGDLIYMLDGERVHLPKGRKTVHVIDHEAVTIFNQTQRTTTRRAKIGIAAPKNIDVYRHELEAHTAENID